MTEAVLHCGGLTDKSQLAKRMLVAHSSGMFTAGNNGLGRDRAAQPIVAAASSMLRHVRNHLSLDPDVKTQVLTRGLQLANSKQARASWGSDASFTSSVGGVVRFNLVVLGASANKRKHRFPTYARDIRRITRRGSEELRQDRLRVQ